MARVRVFIAIVLSIGATGLAGCGRGDDAAAAASVRYAVLNADDQPLRDDFNRDKGKVRLMFLVPPDAVWSGQDPPRASFLMHQLGGLDSRKFPRLNGQLFAAQVNSMLMAMDQKAAAQ